MKRRSYKQLEANKQIAEQVSKKQLIATSDHVKCTKSWQQAGKEQSKILPWLFDLRGGLLCERPVETMDMKPECVFAIVGTYSLYLNVMHCLFSLHFGSGFSASSIGIFFRSMC